MKILNYGSLNIDEVFAVPRFVRPGETLSASRYERFTGGKGLNQSVALARAGAQVTHLGAIGEDGAFLLDCLRESGADVSAIRTAAAPSGRAVIQVDGQGQNCILLLPGANALFDPDHVCRTLDRFSPGDWLLTQNETARPDFAIREAKKRGLSVAFNPSPINETALEAPLDAVDLFFVNETEGEALSGESDPQKMPAALRSRFPSARFVLTLGAQGAVFFDKTECFRVPAHPVSAVDTTGAGDTFTGYFLASLAAGLPVRVCMERASLAASVAVSRKGAAPSIPTKEELGF